MTRELSAEEFVSFFKARGNRSASNIDLTTEIASLKSTKVDAAAFYLAVRELMPNAPRRLLDSCSSLGELFEWYCAIDRSGTEVEGSSSGRVQLRPLRDPDILPLYEAAADPQLGPRWRYRGATPSVAEFVGGLYEGVLAQYAVVDASSGELHGMVCAYNARFELGSVYIGLVRCSRGSGAGEVMEGLFQLIEQLFQNWSFRKVYAEIPEFNAIQILDQKMDLIRVEGRLIEHNFYAGRWWDQLIIAIWREDWLKDEAIRPRST